MDWKRVAHIQVANQLIDTKTEMLTTTSKITLKKRNKNNSLFQLDSIKTNFRTLQNLNIRPTNLTDRELNDKDRNQE